SNALLIAQVGIKPLVNVKQVGSGMSAIQIAEIDDKLQGAAVSQEVRRIKVWNRSGTIIYSDNHALIGRTFLIDTDLGEALAGESCVSITDGHEEVHAGDDMIGTLVQVYVML